MDGRTKGRDIERGITPEPAWDIAWDIAWEIGLGSGSGSVWAAAWAREDAGVAAR